MADCALGRPIRPRKSHIKSRHGCGNCKKRRIKCDENRPQCFNCHRHGIGCDYLTPENSIIPFTAPLPTPKLATDLAPAHTSILTLIPLLETPTPTPATSTAASPIPIITPAAISSPTTKITSAEISASTDDTELTDAEFSRLHMGQLELLHFFLTVTTPTISDVTDGDLWLNHVPLLAFKHDFLMYAILTIAATQLRIQREVGTAAAAANVGSTTTDRSRDSYFERAEIWYRQRALETFRIAISGLRTGSQLEAMTVAGSLIAIQSFAYREKSNGEAGSGGHPSIDANPVIISIDRWLPLLLGIRTVVHEMMNAQTGIDLQSIFGIDFSNLPVATPSATDNGPPLQDFQELLEQHFVDRPTDLVIYMPAVRLLAQLVGAFEHARPAELRKYVFTWPFLCSQEFLTRLRNRDSLALIVFVHYLAVLSLLHAWWQEERVRVDTTMICRTYLRNGAWIPWLKWPRQVLSFDMYDESNDKLLL
ncbi:hypothetical protein V1514DRAFT_201730 [Lipomyces japonicus]|uniref:uncharacterized protein n=1 Tax=Lipomyces japonicus TaxID=56871 RepID=UPI0034CD36D5